MNTLRARYRGDTRLISQEPLAVVKRQEFSVTADPVPMKDMFGEPHGSVLWDHPRRKTGSSAFHKWLRDESGMIKYGSLPKFTQLVVEGVRYIRQDESLGFVIGGLNTNGIAKSLNWPRLAANITATEANFGFQVYGATSAPLPTEYSFGHAGFTQPDFNEHWDHNVATLGGAIVDFRSDELMLLERPSTQGYMLVTSGWNQSRGTRLEIQMAKEVNDAARSVGEEEPRIVMLDVDYSVSGMNNLKAYLIYNAAFAGALVRMAREMVLTRDTHPHLNERIRSDLEQFHQGIPQIREQFDEAASVAQDLRGARRDVTADHYRMRQVYERAVRLPTIIQGVETGVAKALERVA